MNAISPTNTNNDWLAYRGRYVNVTFMLKKGEAEYLIAVRDERVAQVEPGPHPHATLDVRGRCGQ